MASPSQAQFHSWTDRVAALVQKDLDGFSGELSGATIDALGVLIDGSADLELQAALLPTAIDADEMSLPANWATALANISARNGYRDFAAALNAFLTTAAGGSYSGLRAALTDKSAVVHPLFAEVFRKRFAESAFTLASAVTTVFSPAYACQSPDRVYTGADGSLVDDTVDAQDVGTADVALFAANGNALYVGCRFKFTGLVAALSTLASVTITPSFKYWDGNQWATLTVTDNTAGFTRNDLINWTAPANWTRCAADAGATGFTERTPLYWIRISRGAVTVVTPPVGTCLRVIPSIITAVGSTHLGVPQPPLAVVRISATNTIALTRPADVDYTRFQPPALVLRALTPISANVTHTLSYVDQDGNNASQAQSAWSSINALDELAVSFAGGDTGARNVRDTGNSAVTSATQGVYEVAAAPLRTPVL